MAEARGRERWAHTSAILALIANVNRNPKRTRPYKPSDFDPYSAPGSKDRHDQAIELTDLSVLKQAFVGSQQPPLEATS